MEILTDNTTDNFKEVLINGLKQEQKLVKILYILIKHITINIFQKYENRMFTSIKYTEWQEMLDNIFLSYQILKKLKNILN